MTKELLRTVKENVDTLHDLLYRFDSLLARGEENKKKGIIVSLPEFEAYGWERLGKFLERLEDAVNTPLLEEARSILDGLEVPLQTLEKLKSALSVRRDGLIAILREMSKEFKKIQNGRLQNRARADIAKYVDDGRWDELVERANKWRKLEEDLGPLLKAMSNGTYLYKAVFERALEEGPLTDLVNKLEEIEGKASRIGGEALKERVKFEEVRSQVNPLGGIEDDLNKIVTKKEELRQLMGEEVEMDKLIERNKPLSTTIDKLDKEYKRVKGLFDVQYRTVEKLLRIHNNLATILKRNAKAMPPETSLKRLKEFGGELEGDIKKLGNELERTLPADARRFIESLLEGKLPEGWDEKRIVGTLKELLDKKISFEVKLRG